MNLITFNEALSDYRETFSKFINYDDARYLEMTLEPSDGNNIMPVKVMSYSLDAENRIVAIVFAGNKIAVQACRAHLSMGNKMKAIERGYNTYTWHSHDRGYDYSVVRDARLDADNMLLVSRAAKTFEMSDQYSYVPAPFQSGWGSRLYGNGEPRSKYAVYQIGFMVGKVIGISDESWFPYLAERGFNAGLVRSCVGKGMLFWQVSHDEEAWLKILSEGVKNNKLTISRK